MLTQTKAKVVDKCKLFLEHFPKPGQVPHRIPIERLPFRIGRSKNADFTIYSSKVSKEHAEIVELESFRFAIRDMGSTNGTFVNGKRVREAMGLVNGDIVHVAHEEFRFGLDAPEAPPSLGECMTDPITSQLPKSILRSYQYLRELIEKELVTTVFQPIVDMHTERPMGFEALGRGRHMALSSSPRELFALAEQCRLAGELCRTFRAAAVAEVGDLPDHSLLFLNLHPVEMEEFVFLEHLPQIKTALKPRQRLVLEVHETAITDLNSMRSLHNYLKELDIGLAYDDFGVGQARFLELAEIPPDFIKLDMQLIRGLHLDKPRQEIVQSLCRMIRDCGVHIVAEGIETDQERDICRQMGAHFGQGYLFGAPQPVMGLKGPAGD